MNAEKKNRITDIACDLQKQFAQLSADRLKAVDDGITVYYHPDGDVVVITGDPHDRARNGSSEYLSSNGWHSVMCTSGGLWKSTAAENREWLNDQVDNWAEALFDSIEQYEIEHEDKD